MSTVLVYIQFEEAVDLGLISNNPAKNIKISKVNRKKGAHGYGVENRFQPVYLTIPEAQNTLKLFENDILYLAVYMTMYYGLRRSELLGIKWSAIDFEKSTLTIEHTVVRYKTLLCKNTTKNEASHETYSLTEQIRRFLLRHKEMQLQNKKSHGTKYMESDYLFVWPNGKSLLPDYISGHFREVLEKNGHPPMRFHDLRHTCGSIVYEQGGDIKAAQTWLRHADMKTTSDIYMHLYESRKDALSGMIEEAIYPTHNKVLEKC